MAPKNLTSCFEATILLEYLLQNVIILDRPTSKAIRILRFFYAIIFEISIKLCTLSKKIIVVELYNV